MLRGHSSSAPGPVTPPAAPPRGAAPRWYWLAADVLLIALALLLVFKNPAPVSVTKRALAVGAVVLGGGLAMWALRPGAGE